MKSTLLPLLLASALSASAAFGAESAVDMYRSVMPDGSVRYGESPDPGARSVRKVAPPPASTGVITVTPAEKGRTFDPPPTGGTSVMTQPPRPPTEAAQQGRLQAPHGLPGRSY
ncbi:MAG TPA: hypothetical protein VD867_00085 [Burkholderiales bacterium]|nr:hypothetical protein [Burkholderiales bacterium]